MAILMPMLHDFVANLSPCRMSKLRKAYATIFLPNVARHLAPCRPVAIELKKCCCVDFRGQ